MLSAGALTPQDLGNLAIETGRALGCQGTNLECTRFYVARLTEFLKSTGRKLPAAGNWLEMEMASREFLAHLSRFDVQ